MIDRLRYKVSWFLMDCAYRISREAYCDEFSDSGFCEDCDQRMPDEPSWCR